MKTRDQLTAHEPGRSSVHAVLSTQRLRLSHRVQRAAIRERSVQCRDINTCITGVPSDHRGITKILAEREVR
jgi:hypothetical protein